MLGELVYGPFVELLIKPQGRN